MSLNIQIKKLLMWIELGQGCAESRKKKQRIPVHFSCKILFCFLLVTWRFENKYLKKKWRVKWIKSFTIKINRRSLFDCSEIQNINVIRPRFVFATLKRSILPLPVTYVSFVPHTTRNSTQTRPVFENVWRVNDKLTVNPKVVCRRRGVSTVCSSVGFFPDFSGFPTPAFFFRTPSRVSTRTKRIVKIDRPDGTHDFRTN